MNNNEIAQDMTLRDYFAAKSLPIVQSMESGWHTVSKKLGIDASSYNTDIHYPKYVAKLAYEFADAMLEARK